MDEPKQTKEEEYLGNWKRAQADLENYKKSEVQRMEEVVKFGSEKLVLGVIEVLTGMEMAFKQFEILLKKYGVERIAVVGQKFDPNVHEAVDEIDESKPLAEVRTGYIMHGKVILPARVKNG